MHWSDVAEVEEVVVIASSCWLSWHFYLHYFVPMFLFNLNKDMDMDSSTALNP